MKETHCLGVLVQLSRIKGYETRNSHYVADGLVLELRDENGESYDIKITPKEVKDGDARIRQND